MDIGLLTIITVDGLNYAATLFLIAVGLTLVFGVLRILNVSHGGIYAFGAYLATWLALWFLDVGLPAYLSYLMLLAGAVIIGLISGPIIERLLLRRIYGSDMHIQLLLTFSILLILDDLMKLIWGTQPMFVNEPYALLGTFSVAGIIYPWYEFLVVGVAVVFGGALVWLNATDIRLGSAPSAVARAPEPAAVPDRPPPEVVFSLPTQDD
ncbi:MAG: branched-chain amino acid ABC transporter permease, partial [Anaerolineae bacterium]